MFTAAIPKCNLCGEPVFNNHHKCPPAWEGCIDGIHAEGEFHPNVIFAASPMAAARKLAEIYNVYEISTVTVRNGGEEITLEINLW